jgi:hypothetical protein
MLVGNVRLKLDLWVFDHVYHFEDAGALAAAVALGLVAWGLARHPVCGKGGQNA